VSRPRTRRPARISRGPSCRSIRAGPRFTCAFARDDQSHLSDGRKRSSPSSGRAVRHPPGCESQRTPRAPATRKAPPARGRGVQLCGSNAVQLLATSVDRGPTERSLRGSNDLSAQFPVGERKRNKPPSAIAIPSNRKTVAGSLKKRMPAIAIIAAPPARIIGTADSGPPF